MTLRVAIIEDSADLLDELLAFLRHRGFDAWGVGSAEAFWRQLHRDPVDIVLIDIGLPGEDGLSVLDYLHEIGQFGLVVITARGHEQDRLQALNAGADLYLIKPVNFSDLAESTRRWLPASPATTGGTRQSAAISRAASAVSLGTPERAPCGAVWAGPAAHAARVPAAGSVNA